MSDLDSPDEPPLPEGGWGLGRLVDHPWAVALAILVITGLSIVGYHDPYLLIPEPTYEGSQELPVQITGPTEERPLPNVVSTQLGGWEVVLLVKSKDLFTPSSAKALRHVVEELDALQHVGRMNWLDRGIPLNIFGLAEPVFPHSKASQVLFESAREKAIANPMVGGYMLSSDCTTTMIMMQIDWLFVTSDEDCSSGLREVAERAAAEIPGSDLTFQVTGRVPIDLALRKRNRSNERTYQIIANCFTLVMAMILFRGFTPVIIVAIAPGLGVFWTLGLLNFFELQDNPFNHVVLPILISMVGFTDGVHMMVQIRTNRAAGHSPRNATRIALREVGLACGLTSLTTAIGFGSLSLAHHEIVKEFGWCCVLGVIVTFLSVIFVIPLLCLTPLGKSVQAGYSRGLIDRHFSRAVWIVDWVLKHYRAVSAASVLCLLALVAISGTLRPDERRTSALPSTGEELEALRAMDQAFGGLETAEVVVRWNDEVPEGDAEMLEVMQQVDEILKSEELLGHPISLASLVAALPGTGTPEQRVSMIELLPPPLKRAFYIPERNWSQAIFRVQDLGIAKYGPVFKRVQQQLLLVQNDHPNFSVVLSGSAVWRWENLYQVVVDLAMSLGTAIIIIFVVLTIVYRSLRIGLISIVPNVFPLAATGTLLVFVGQALEIVSVCAFTVCLGIAVDDTIHFLTRFNEERKKTDDASEAIRKSFVAVGTALIMTTVVLIGGFATALSSDTRDHQIFATMAILTIASALLADLILLPALLVFFRSPTEKPADGETEPSSNPSQSP